MSAMPSPAPEPAAPPMLHALARYWWLILLRGIAAIIFGVLAFIWPGITLVTLVLFYGAFALVDGVLALVHAFMGGNMGSRWWLALIGVLGIADRAAHLHVAGRSPRWCCWCSSPPGRSCSASSRSSARSGCARKSTMSGR